MFVVFLARGGALTHLAKEDGASWLATFAEPGHHPHAVVVETLERLGLTPRVVHSTSWRLEENQLLLTYMVAVRPMRLWPDALRPMVLHKPRQLTRGAATAPPEQLTNDDVLVHALRHLAWLYFDDAAVRRTLGHRWRAALRPYLPAPFMALAGRRARRRRAQTALASASPDGSPGQRSE